MSSEDLPTAIYNESNDEESSDTLLSGIILIPQENDESEAQGAELENKYVIHEVMIEIMESNDDVKPEVALFDEDPAPDIPSEDVAEANRVDKIMLLDKDSASNITLQQVEEVNKTTLRDKEPDADVTLERAKDVNVNMIKESNKIMVQSKETDLRNISHKAENAEGRISEENGSPQHIDTDYEQRLIRPIIEERVMPPVGQKGNVQLFTKDTGPQLYKAGGSLVTAPIITKNLPTVFDYLPIHGKPQDSNNLNEYFSHKIREFVGCGLTDHEFKQLENYCSPEQLKTGEEIEMETNVPVVGVIDGKVIENFDRHNKGEAPELCILKKNKLRIQQDTKGQFTKKLKYRSVRNLPFTQEVYHLPPQMPCEHNSDIDLEPGKDILYRVRVYRPYVYSQTKDRFTRTRHSVFCCDIVLAGRNRLSALRDRFVCHNDFDMRVDVSNHPDMLPSAKAKEVFPSGFLFINNVFYVDTREGCVDYSEPIREWARRKELGVFPRMDMCAVRLEELTLKLGYPEVYVHQGNCEHVFLFSEIRLLNPTDPLRLSNYPCTTAIAQNQTVYCTTCAEFSAKWIVVGCDRVPFDPAFFCDTCFRQYLYIDGQKIGDFKAYAYRGNALNLLKPQ